MILFEDLVDTYQAYGDLEIEILPEELGVHKIYELDDGICLCSSGIHIPEEYVVECADWPLTLSYIVESVENYRQDIIDVDGLEIYIQTPDRIRDAEAIEYYENADKICIS